MQEPNWKAVLLHRIVGGSGGVRTLMGLSARSTWVLGAVAASMSIFQDLTTTRLYVLAVIGGLWAMVHIASWVLGMLWPERFHYGAQELMERERRRGDSLSGEPATGSGAEMEQP